MKLTKTQREILQIAATGDSLYYVGGSQPYFYWLLGGAKRAPRRDMVIRLLDAGLLEWERGGDGIKDRAVISAAGRKALDNQTEN